MNNLFKRKKESRLLMALEIGALTVASNFLAIITAEKPQKERAFYSQLRTPPWAPPTRAFGPVWLFNNIFLFNALLQILDKKTKIKDRNTLLGLQGVLWFNFLAFGYLFFRKKSPILGAAITQSDAVTSTISYVIARRSNKKFALNYLPLMIWTWFATTIADYVALKNPDPLLKTRALMNGGFHFKRQTKKEIH